MPTARLKLTIEVEDWTVEQLKQAVRDLDALEDDMPIAIDNVDAWDVITAIALSRLGVTMNFLENDMED